MDCILGVGSVLFLVAVFVRFYVEPFIRDTIFLSALLLLVFSTIGFVISVTG